MIQEFVQKWEANKGKIETKFRAKHPDNYGEIVRYVIETLNEGADWMKVPDPENIHEINDGDYQGTLVFVISETGYQPSTYWAVKVSYGSCSGCDTLEAIREGYDDIPTERQVQDYMTLALHILQGLKEI